MEDFRLLEIAITGPAVGAISPDFEIEGKLLEEFPNHRDAFLSVFMTRDFRLLVPFQRTPRSFHHSPPSAIR